MHFTILGSFQLTLSRTTYSQKALRRAMVVDFQYLTLFFVAQSRFIAH